MQFKNLFKYLPIAIIAASLAVATSAPPPHSINNSDYSKEQIFNTDQKVSDTDNSDQLEYIRNDVEKQDGVANSIASIKLASSGSFAYHSAALVTKTDKSTLLYMWGKNNDGQLGNKITTTNPNPTPTKITIPNSTSTITQIALGVDYSAALMDDGSLYTWGNNKFGQLGNGTTTNTSTPTPVDSTPFGTNKITQIAIGNRHSAAILEDGGLYMWGDNKNGQLGNGTKLSASTPTPVDSTLFGFKKVTQIALGDGHSAALMQDNTLYTWGSGAFGQLGNNSTNSTSTPTQVVFLTGKNIIQIALGYNYSAALLKDGTLYMWGSNDYGQLGNGTSGTMANKYIPNLVTALSGKKITQISLGTYHSAALLEDGSLYTWGYNDTGQLGNGNTSNTLTPDLISPAFFSSKIIQISLGYDHSTILLEDGRFYMWGRNNFGQLGFISNLNTPNPNPIWMSQLGKDSFITANDKITAKEAVNKFLVNNSFNLDGFKNSFNLINVPITNQQITMDVSAHPPTYDNDARTVTINVKIKYFYDENGFIVTDSSAEPITISGFKKASTDMTINPDYPRTRVNLFALNILNHKGSDLYNYLVKDYVIATSVDADKLTARIINQDNQTGKIQIALTIPSYYDDDLNIVEESRTYTFDYELTPKYQQTTIRTLDVSVYPKDITPAQFKQQIIDGGAVTNGDNFTLTPTNMTFLKKFLSFESVPTGTVCTLTWNDDQTDDATGVLSFNLSLDKYYSVDGDLVTSALPVHNLTLDLLGSDAPSVYPETKISTKANAPAITSSQSFLDMVYANSEVDNGKLSLYIDGLQTIPATGDITNIATQTETDDIATFNLDISAHYDASGILQGHKSFNFNLRISLKYSETNITVLPEGSYPTDFTPTQFKQQLINDGADVQGSIYALNAKNISLLYRFLDLTTVPSNTKYILTWNDDQINNTTGQISFNLIIDQYYNADGNLVSDATKPFNDLVLQLANVDTPAIKAATSLKTKVGSPTVASKNAFMQIIYTTDNHLIYSQLDIFVDGLLTIPTAAAVTVSYITENKGIAVFRVILSGYYDGVSADMINEKKAYNFEVNVKYVPISYDRFPILWFIIVGLGAWALLIAFIGFTGIRYQQWAAKNRKVKVKKAKPEKQEMKFKWFKATKDDSKEKKPKDSNNKTKNSKKVKSKKKTKWFKTSKTNKTGNKQIKPKASGEISKKSSAPKANVKLLESKATRQVRKPKVDNEAKKPKTSNNTFEKAKTPKTNAKQVEPKVSDTAIKQAKKTKTQTDPKNPKSSDQVPKKVKIAKSHNDQLKQNDSKNIIEPTDLKSSNQVSEKVKTDKSLNDQLKQNDPKKTIKTDTKQRIDKSRTLNSKPKVDNTTDLSKKKTDTKPK